VQLRTEERHEKSNFMNQKMQAADQDLGTLAEDARALMAATANVAGDKVEQARRHLAVTLERGKEMYIRAREKAAEKARAADQVVRMHPYHATFIAFGVGALIGCLLAPRGSGRACD
jgi:ElaB/YqjD/DUF883 family membrane-anchored ribosome-binding protein